MRRALLLTALLIAATIPSFAQDTAVDRAFEFKGIYLGMPVAEFGDSVQSTTFFLYRQPVSMTHLLGENRETFDTLLGSALYAAQMSLGCLPDQYGSGKTCYNLDAGSFGFSRGILTSMHLWERKTILPNGTIEILARGLEEKLGAPTKDRRSTWGTSYGNAERGDRNVLMEWVIVDGARKVVVSLSFTKNKAQHDYVGTDHKSYPTFDVDLDADLTDPELESWHTDVMSPQIQAERVRKEEEARREYEEGVEIEF